MKERQRFRAPQKVAMKPGNMLYPLPIVLVSSGLKAGDHNLMTIAWTGTVCSEPPMVSISIRPSRHSHGIIKAAGEFVINVPDESMARVVDFCGVKSGRDMDKWELMKLKKGSGQKIKTPHIIRAPISLECKTRQVLTLGTHDCFVAEVVNVLIRDDLLDSKGRVRTEKACLLAYSHEGYVGLGKNLGRFGFSVKKT